VDIAHQYERKSMEKLGKRELRRNELRLKILQESKKLLLEGGLDKLSMRTLSERAGISSKTPYLAFNSKDDIVKTLLSNELNPHLDKFFDIISQADLFHPYLLIDVLVEIFKDNEDYFRCLFWGVFTLSSEEDYNQIINFHSATLLHVLQRLVTEKKIQKDTDLTAVSRYIAQSFGARIGTWANRHCSLKESSLHLKYLYSLSLLRIVRPKYRDLVQENITQIEEHLQALN
jgi:AcrR family transcriptional regulator